MAKSTRRTDNVTTATDRSSKTPIDGTVTVTGLDIARRAYDLYLARGCEHGHDEDDWSKAERELRGALPSSAA
jgi:hypothetical protein